MESDHGKVEDFLFTLLLVSERVRRPGEFVLPSFATSSTDLPHL